MNELNKKPIRKFTELKAPRQAITECIDVRIPDCKVKGWLREDLDAECWSGGISLNGETIAAVTITKGKWYAIQMLRGMLKGLLRHIANRLRKKANRNARKLDAVTANPPLSGGVIPAFFTPAAVAKEIDAELKKEGK